MRSIRGAVGAEEEAGARLHWRRCRACAAGMGFECSIVLMAFRSFGAIGADFGDRPEARAQLYRASAPIASYGSAPVGPAAGQRTDVVKTTSPLFAVRLPTSTIGIRRSAGTDGSFVRLQLTACQQPMIGPEDEIHAERSSQGNEYYLRFFQQNFRCAHSSLP